MKKINVTVVTQVRIYKTKDGIYADSSFSKIIERYSNAFGALNLVTRVINSSETIKGYVDISKYCKTTHNVGSIPKYIGRKPSSKLQQLIKNSDLVVLRVPSLVSMKTYSLVKKYNKKYLTEVMGCAWDAYWNHGLSGKIIAPFAYKKMKTIVKNANYSLYVTQQFLQNRYPCDGKTVGVSNVNIKTIDKPKQYKDFNPKSFTMMTAGAVNVKYKGQEYVIRAMKELKEKHGIRIKYYLAGKGDSTRLKRIAKQNGVEDDVVFLGMLSKEELAKKMREIDIYVQPSLQEGLPRSLIEAMSHGCVCLGARTAGIPELLDGRSLFERKNSQAITSAIKEAISLDLFTMSARNIAVARKYETELLNNTRNDFFGTISEGINK